MWHLVDSVAVQQDFFFLSDILLDQVMFDINTKFNNRKRD